MLKKKNQPQKYSDEDLILAARKYETRKAMRESDDRIHQSMYVTIKARGLSKIAFKHMKYIRKPNGTWGTKKAVLDEAKKYKTVTQFKRNAAGAYDAAQKNGWMTDVSNVLPSSQYKSGPQHMLYAIYNPLLKLAYVGQTTQAFASRIVVVK